MAEPRNAGSTAPSWVGDGVEPLAQVNVRADAGAARALDLPAEPNTSRVDGGRHSLWLGPDEWLVVEPDGDPVAIARDLEARAGDGWVTTVDLSSNRVAFTTTREVLAYGCSLDLHPRSFGPGRCAQTLLARAPVILEALSDGTLRVLARASFAGYVRAWLDDAASA
jgi:sarcosine oxidase subunit gamma